jgi:hypothetical protein
MKILFMLIILLANLAHSQSIQLRDHRWVLNDVEQLGQNKMELYQSMNRTLVKVHNSICSNRAQVWAYDFKRSHKIDSAKIFLFYTNNTPGVWWYHVSPVINEKNQIWVMDAGFPWMFKKPLTLNEWFKEFTKYESCREIRLGENELIEKIFKEQKFPTQTSYGSHNCYYALAPAGYWTPGQLAKGLLGYNEAGKPTHFFREAPEKNEVFQACLETATSPIGYALGAGNKACRNFIEN